MDARTAPPKLAEWLLKRLFPDHGQFTTLGDLEEVFHAIAGTEGTAQARFWYWRQTIKSIPTFVTNSVYWSTVMLKNYFKIAFRNIVKDKWYSIINFAGLVVGITCFSLLMLLVQYEFAYDSSHSKADRIYRLIQVLDEPGQTTHEASSSRYMADALMQEFPEVESAAPVFPGMPSRVRFEEKSFVEEDFILSNQNFFNIFDLEFVQGNMQTALINPFSVVLTEETAEKYFTGRNPIGRSLNFSRYGDFQVTGVVKALPPNSSLNFSMLLSDSYDIYLLDVHPNFLVRFNSWDGRPCTTFALFREGISVSDFQAKLPAFLDKHRTENGRQSSFYLQNLSDTHFHSANIRRTFGKLGDLKQITFFSAIGLFVLLIACVNYMNLAAARSAKRAKEVGMRLAVGAGWIQIALQFFGESILLALLALIPALFLVNLVLPLFNQMTQLQLALNPEILAQLLVIMVPVTVLVGFLSGSYPAMFLAKLKPVKVLKSSERTNVTSHSLLKKGLVIFQFAISVTLIVATLIIQKQLKFISDKDLGFQNDQLLVIEINDGNVRDNFQTIKSEFLKDSRVQQVAGVSRVISGYRTPPQIEAVLEGGSRDSFVLYFYGMDEDGLDALGLELLAGRNFSTNPSENSQAILVNETAARLLGVGSPVGKILFTEADNYRAEVIGVLKDFHYQSLHQAIRPLAIGYLSNPVQSLDDIVVKISGQNISETLAFLEQTYVQFDVNQEMDFRFLDDMMDEHYRADVAFRKVFGFAAGLAIFIACLGLIGLTAFSVERRLKEFGIRRVLGASASKIIELQLSEFLKLVLVASIIAWPIAWFVSDGWLQNFSYRVSISWDVFLLSGLFVVLLTILTVTAISVRAARANPVESLRSE